MAVHHPHLLDFSNTVVAAMEPAPPSLFDHGHQQLLALHVDGTDMLPLGAGGGVPAPHHQQHHHHRVLADDDTAAAWQPQAGVSLSLYNSNSYSMAGRSSSPLFGGHHHQQQFAAVPNSNQHQLPESSTEQPFQLRNSRYLGLAQELLSEFCSLQGDFLHAINKKGGKIRDDAAETSSSSSGLWGHPSLSSMDPFELERRKARLLSMLEEVDRRYRRYREQMRAVEVSFEAVAGAGAAQVYTRLALRAMSRHFRCLRDALVAQVRALRKAMGERDGGGASPAGATKGDTPRLKVLDQCLRQQRAFQQPGAIENYPWRPQRGLPERAVAVLRAWLFDHFLHPYPNDVDKHILARQTGLSRSQVSNWFINARVRLWKPMVEEMYTEEVKQQSENRISDGGGGSIIKPEQHNTRAIAGGESQFRTSSSSGAAVVSLTLGLQQQPFAMPHHQRSVMLQQGEDDDEAVLPYPWS
ncbi:unnamed protein product [Urochloa decumbens]|uniref:Homeobox domain-containing protein n=1 Tax=Urochloa decumbens TaxID=240449 RepID=A0ABC9DV31_9POAL